MRRELCNTSFQKLQWWEKHDNGNKAETMTEERRNQESGCYMHYHSTIVQARMTAYNVNILQRVGTYDSLQCVCSLRTVSRKVESSPSMGEYFPHISKIGDKNIQLSLSHIQDRPQDGLKLWTLTYNLASPRAGMTGLNQQAHLPLFCFESDIR